MKWAEHGTFEQCGLSCDPSAGVEHPDAKAVVEKIAQSASPEEAAQLGRSVARSMPHLVCPQWLERKLDVMLEALRVKFNNYEGPRQMLLDTQNYDDIEVVELSPHDYFWGHGADGSGENQLGKLLIKLRAEISDPQPTLEPDVVIK